MTKNKNLTFIKYFTYSFLTTFIIYLSILVYINPKQTFNILPSNKFSKYTDNFIYLKIKSIETNHDFQTVIIGSSTSESFNPADVNFILNTNSFSASTGGGNTPTRYALFNSAVKNMKNLKRIIYIADFFEFNRPTPKDEVILSEKVNTYLDVPELKPNLLIKMKHIFSHQLFESIFKVIKKLKKDKRTLINSNGTSDRSMILSPIDNANAFSSQIPASQKFALLKQIKENYTTYSQRVLNNFTELSPLVIKLFEKMNSLAKENNIQIIYILAPYHNDFRNMLFQDPKISKRYNEWQSLFRRFAKNSNILLYNPLTSKIAIDPMSGVWRDGIHFNRQSSSYMLKEISKEIKK